MPQLTSNVHVDGTWYGPDYPQNGEPPSGTVTNPAAFATPEEFDVLAAGNKPGGVDLRFRADDFGVESGEQPNLRADEFVNAGPTTVGVSAVDTIEPPRKGAGSGREAWAAFAASRSVDVPDGASRDEIVAELEARGIVEPE